jgi:Protein of unknown function (DUF3341)
MTLLGVFREPEAVADAMDALRNAGFSGRELTVLSGTPYPEGAFGEEPVRHRLYVFPFIGAACGFLVGLLLTIGTQLSYPLVTGGKPLLSLPPMINVLYEGTLLGALIFTVAGVIFESRLPDLGGTPYDPRISEGYLGVVVRAADARVAQAAELLRRAGAEDVVA